MPTVYMNKEFDSGLIRPQHTLPAVVLMYYNGRVSFCYTSKQLVVMKVAFGWFKT